MPIHEDVCVKFICALESVCREVRVQSQGFFRCISCWSKLSEQVRLTGWALMGSVVFLTSSFFTWILRIKSDSHFFFFLQDKHFTN